MKWLALGLAVLAAACVTVTRPAMLGCGGAPDAARVMEAIIDADNDRDLARVMGHYTSDVIWYPPGRAPVVGAGAVRQSYENMYAHYRPALSIEVDDTRLGVSGAVVEGRTGGRLRPTDGGAVVDVADRFSAVLVCDTGRWRVAQMSWSPQTR